MKAFLLLSLLCAAAQAAPQTTDAFAECRKLGRGVNIIGYDPMWRALSAEEGRFKARHFELLKKAGFNSVRINLAPFRRMEQTNGESKLPDKWFSVLDWAIGRAREQGLTVILDCHEFTRLGQDPEGNKEKLMAFWRIMSERYQNAPDDVYFEVLNEPNKKLTPTLWNEYFKEALAIIREKNPVRPVVVGPAFWNSIEHLDELALPENDRHLIVTVHYYLPMRFTHQGASWVEQKSETGVEWGSEEERAALAKHFDRVADWSKKHQRPIYLGEFGAYDKGPRDSRARYTSAVARAAEQRGWSWGYWQFDSDFILYDIPNDRFVEPILSALIPK